MTITQPKSVFRSKFFQVTSFILGPILISIGIFVVGIYLKIIFMVSGIGLIIGLYFSRRLNNKLPEDICNVCNGTGTIKIKSSMMSEHSVKNCHSYRVGTKTCGMCEGTGLKKNEGS